MAMLPLPLGGGIGSGMGSGSERNIYLGLLLKNCVLGKNDLLCIGATTQNNTTNQCLKININVCLF